MGAGALFGAGQTGENVRSAEATSGRHLQLRLRLKGQMRYHEPYARRTLGSRPDHDPDRCVDRGPVSGAEEQERTKSW